MDLQHISVKLYAETKEPFEMASLIPVFHRWIQQQSLSDVLMIDVADYSHVHHGPGVMLICHEGHFAVNEDGGRPGVLYANKRMASGSTRERMQTALNRARTAAGLLRDDSDLSGEIEISEKVLRFRFDDFLHTSDGDEAYAAIEGDLKSVIAETYGGGEVKLERVRDDVGGEFDGAGFGFVVS